MTYRIMPYDGWELAEILVDGVPVQPVGLTYTFKGVTESHTIHVSAIKSSEPTPERYVDVLIDHLLNGTEIDVNAYDLDKNGVIDGRDLILLQQTMN